MSKKTEEEPRLSDDDIARRRDETIKRMIATPPLTQKGKPKRAPKGRKRPAEA